MGDQLRLFRLTQSEVEVKTRHIVTAFAQLQDAGERLKAAQELLRGSAEANAVKEIKEEIKSCRETANRLIAELDSEKILEVEG